MLLYMLTLLLALAVYQSERMMHDHVVTQASKFNTAFKKPETRSKIVDAVYNEILSDPFKEVL